MNKLRHLLADRIEANGGYSRGYHDRYAIEFDVSLWRVDLSRDHIYEVMCEQHGYLPPPTGLEWDQQQQWDWAQETLCYGLNNNETYNTYGPLTAIKYGLPYYRFPRKYKRKGTEGCYYPSKLEGWILDKPYECIQFDVKLGLAGRGGKHLVVSEFDGKSLELSSKELAEMIRDPEDQGYSNQWCVHLLAMMDEWEKCFTSKIASDEMEYQAAFNMHQALSERTDAWRSKLAAAREHHNLELIAQAMREPQLF